MKQKHFHFEDEYSGMCAMASVEEEKYLVEIISCDGKNKKYTSWAEQSHTRDFLQDFLVMTHLDQKLQRYSTIWFGHISLGAEIYLF